jgi:hypothetical protein
VVGANGLEPVRYQSDLRILKTVLHNPFRGIAFLLETKPAPTHNNQLILPSGVRVISIELWIEKLMRPFNNPR